MLGPELFRQKVPCADCPFRKDGGVRHSTKRMLSYAAYFLTYPGATFPCHKSVPKDDTREHWSLWREGQVLCVGGLMLAAKFQVANIVTAIAIKRGWYDPATHTAEELALVVDSPAEMVGDDDGR